MPRRTFSFDAKSYVLDARPDRLDLRDRPYAPPTRSLPPLYPTADKLARFLAGYLSAGLILDQGREGACTGYGLAAVVNYMLWTRALERNAAQGFQPVSPHMFYDLARFYDEWPGEDYEGSSCRGAMKGWHKHGACAQGLWRKSVHRKLKRHYKPDPTWATDAAARPVGVYYRVDHRSVTDMQAAINEMGAIYVSAAVHAGWDIPTVTRPPKVASHADLPVIDFEATTKPDGAHAFALVGYNEDGFVVQNSWGPTWGAHGFAIMAYADWVAHGTDAWVCSLGVPQRVHPLATAGPRGARARQASGLSLARDARLDADPDNPAVEPWGNEQAYLHTVVAGNDGLVRIGLPHIGDPADLVDLVVRQNVKAWLQGDGKTSRKVMLYAHGGLNSEEESILRIRVLAPYFLANGIYPIFYSWRSGIWETIGSRLEDKLGIKPGEARATGFVGEATDLLLEAAAHGMKWIWNEMKENVEGATTPAGAAPPAGALTLIAGSLQRLAAEGNGIELHLVGHSAGAFVLGHLLDLLAAKALKPASLTLYAPACPLPFALAKFRNAVQSGHLPAANVWLHLLSDRRETDDTTGPYGKSLLYLVCRGFEETRKTPLAGLQRCLDVNAVEDDDDLWASEFWGDVQAWRTWVNGLPAQSDGKSACEIFDDDSVSTGKASIAPSHGSFDNNKVVIERSINRILGRPPGAALAAPVEDLDY
ncbi:MAG: C1 family peptidase [Betaproteobacteria bacterium]|nr:C1 family peptidase [Betaproteobacteria bacterium]